MTASCRASCACWRSSTRLFGARSGERPRLEGHLRIKAPTTLATALTSEGCSAEFQAEHPGVSLDVILMDRSVNPLEEGFDLALGAFPVSYPNVQDIPLCQYELVTLLRARRIFGARRAPQHPTELVDYECLTTTLFRTTWVFESSRGALSVEVHSRLHASDSRMLRESALHGLGVAILPRFLAEEALESGALVPLLQDFPVATHWVKALVPRMKMNRPVVRELVAFLKARLQQVMHATPA